MYKIQAVEAPPQSTLRMTHGDVLVTKLVDQASAPPAPMQVVGSASTMTLVNGQDSEIDWLQVQDPWAKKVNRVAPMQNADDPMEDLESRITEAVMTRLERGRSMQVDDGDEVQDRVAALEHQMNDLQVHQQQLQVTVQTHQVEQAAQVQRMQSTFQQQHDRLEHILNSNTAQFREEFSKQTHNQTVLESMMQQQMQQIETLINENKRAKVSGPE